MENPKKSLSQPGTKISNAENPGKDHTFSEESAHLKEVEEWIDQQLAAMDISLGNAKSDLISQKQYLWENIYEMRPPEIRSAKAVMSQDENMYAQLLWQKQLLQRQQKRPYFGRIDFVYDGDDGAETLYIGPYGLRDKNTQTAWVYDWRSPIASMYYDFGIGNAHYEAPVGRLTGEIKDKRQIKIKDGRLEYVLSSSLLVHDELLQRELANHKSTKMHNIVATIQKEQNSAIRDQSSPILLIQGTAGSGKTSVALHRIAFLLYQNHADLHSNEVLILSPNHIFSEYISNVLPELGEENICEMSFQMLAQHELAGICKFETKYEQMEYVVGCQKGEDARLHPIQFKNSLCFLKELKQFVKKLEDELVQFTDYTFSLPDRLDENATRSYTMLAGEMQKLYQGNFSSLPVFRRLLQIAEQIADNFEAAHKISLSTAAKDEIRHGIFAMCRTNDVLEIYADFLRVLGKKYPPVLYGGTEPDGFLTSGFLQEDSLPASVSREQDGFSASEFPPEPLTFTGFHIPGEKYLLYEDVFPVLLVKLMLFGKESSRFDRIRHVIVDEMQDYSMVQYELLKLLFHCNMTLLGDINQKIDGAADIPLPSGPQKDTFLDGIQEIFAGKTTLVRLEKSYRSTFEISEFCQKLGGFSKSNAFCRHGSAPVLTVCHDYSDLAAKLQHRLDAICPSETITTAIICKTSSAAKKLYRTFDPVHRGRCHFMITEDDDFLKGILITNPYLAKGLEFDLVIIPEATKEAYSSEKDRQVLYISCTRALHGLEIFYYGEISPFFAFASGQPVQIE